MFTSRLTIKPRRLSSVVSEPTIVVIMVETEGTTNDKNVSFPMNRDDDNHSQKLQMKIYDDNATNDNMMTTILGPGKHQNSAFQPLEKTDMKLKKKEKRNKRGGQKNKNKNNSKTETNDNDIIDNDKMNYNIYNSNNEEKKPNRKKKYGNKNNKNKTTDGSSPTSNDNISNNPDGTVYMGAFYPNLSPLTIPEYQQHYNPYYHYNHRPLFLQQGDPTMNMMHQENQGRQDLRPFLSDIPQTNKTHHYSANNDQHLLTQDNDSHDVDFSPTANKKERMQAWIDRFNQNQSRIAGVVYIKENGERFIDFVPSTPGASNNDDTTFGFMLVPCLTSGIEREGQEEHFNTHLKLDQMDERLQLSPERPMDISSQSNSASLFPFVLQGYPIEMMNMSPPYPPGTPIVNGTVGCVPEAMQNHHCQNNLGFHQLPHFMSQHSANHITTNNGMNNHESRIMMNGTTYFGAIPPPPFVSPPSHSGEKMSMMAPHMGPQSQQTNNVMGGGSYSGFPQQFAPTKLHPPSSSKVQNEYSHPHNDDSPTPPPPPPPFYDVPGAPFQQGHKVAGDHHGFQSAAEENGMKNNDASHSNHIGNDNEIRYDTHQDQSQQSRRVSFEHGEVAASVPTVDASNAFVENN